MVSHWGALAFALFSSPSHAFCLAGAGGFGARPEGAIGFCAADACGIGGAAGLEYDP